MTDKEKIKALLKEIEKVRFTNSTLHKQIKNLKKRNEELLKGFEEAVSIAEYYQQEIKKARKSNV